MTISVEQLISEDRFNDCEDLEKYNKYYLPKIEAYRKRLADGVLPQYAIELPKDTDTLVKQQFNALKYLYDEKLLTEEEFAITDCSAVELTGKIAAKHYSSVQVFKAFAKRATICHQLTNCAMELFVDEGLERAKYLDEYLEKNGKPIGPLHGLPVSLKEHMFYKNRICHAGYVNRIDFVAEKHGTNAHILEKLGAVFYIRTSQPQTIMHLDSENNYIGFTRNPHNLSLSSGGSSSGEGSLVAFGGSGFGIGTDIGGSIRSPAAFSGCHGLRPTSKRIGLLGGFSSMVGQESVLGVAGPLTRSIDDIDFWMKSYINGGEPWNIDQNCIRIPWREVEKPQANDLTVAVMYDDGLVKPTPPIQRALKESVARLKAAGVKIIEFDPIKTDIAYETVNRMYGCDNHYQQKTLLKESGEPLTHLTKWCLNFGDGEKSVVENRHLNYIRDSLRQEYNDYFINNKVDFILSPTYNNVAPQSGKIYNWSYTSLFNILDLPTLVIQTGMYQDPSIDKWDDSFNNYKFRSQLEELELSLYDPENFKGAPIGLQLSGRRYFDEEVVAAGKTIVEIFGTDLFKQFQ